jgi:hypothetical protein
MVRKLPNTLVRVLSLFLVCLWAVSCATTPALEPSSQPPIPTSEPTAARIDGLSEEEAATLSSLEQVDSYPLYRMHYYSDYGQAQSSLSTAWQPPSAAEPTLSPAWACSLFAALGDADARLYGRNFDWEYSPALLLFTDPPDGYASVSMVDIAYLGFAGSEADGLAEPDTSLAERRGLLDAPLLPFDGMNDQGLAVGMAAVPPGEMRPDPGKETIGSLGIIRQILDHAANVEEAISIFQSYNVDMAGGPPVHYLIADRTGRAVLVEFYQGEMVLFPNDAPWHLATNFLRASVGESTQGQCWRYDELDRELSMAKGQLSRQDAMDLLSGVSQPGTQWSIVYHLASGEVDVTMGRRYEGSRTFRLGP